MRKIKSKALKSLNIQPRPAVSSQLRAGPGKAMSLIAGNQIKLATVWLQSESHLSTAGGSPLVPGLMSTSAYWLQVPVRCGPFGGVVSPASGCEKNKWTPPEEGLRTLN